MMTTVNTVLWQIQCTMLHGKHSWFCDEYSQYYFAVNTASVPILLCGEDIVVSTEAEKNINAYIIFPPPALNLGLLSAKKYRYPYHLSSLLADFVNLYGDLTH